MVKIVRARLHGNTTEVSLTDYLKIGSFYEVEQIGNKTILTELEVSKK